MRTREFPALSAEDEPLVRRLALGLGDDAARVFGYLLRRRHAVGTDEPADRLALRVGTGLNRATLSKALDRLERRELVTTTTIETDQGRPPTAWLARDTIDDALVRVDDGHGVALLDRAVSVADDLGATVMGSDGGPSFSSLPPDPDASGFTVGLNWFPNALHGPLFAAQAEDAYDDRGLDVTLESFAGSDHAVDAVREGAVDVAVSGAATVTRARASGVPLVPLAPLYQRTMTVLYTTEEAFGGRLEGVECVRGRRVGMPVDAETGLLGRLFLSQSGVVDDVTLVDLSGEESDALSTGRADVVTGTIGDVRALEAAGRTVDVVSVDGHFPIYGPTLVTSTETVRARPAALVAFLAGTVAGWRVASDDPERAVEAVASTEADERTVAELARAVEQFGTSGTVTEHGWGWHDTDGWQRLSIALGQVGLLSGSDETPVSGD